MFSNYQNRSFDRKHFGNNSKDQLGVKLNESFGSQSRNKKNFVQNNKIP